MQAIQIHIRLAKYTNKYVARLRHGAFCVFTSNMHMLFCQSHISYATLVLQPRLKLLTKNERLRAPAPLLSISTSTTLSHAGSVTHLPQKRHYSSISLKLLDFQFIPFVFYLFFYTYAFNQLSHLLLHSLLVHVLLLLLWSSLHVYACILQ